MLKLFEVYETFQDSRAIARKPTVQNDQTIRESLYRFACSRFPVFDFPYTEEIYKGIYVAAVAFSARRTRGKITLGSSAIIVVLVVIDLSDKFSPH